jgi:glutamate/tyrosine decarboxylase-like PLP-dependent enzyme
VHVDGAGLWAAVSPVNLPLWSPDSAGRPWATDAHKWLNVPYDSGLAFCREREALRAAMAVRAPYLPSGLRPRFYTNFPAADAVWKSGQF